ncbi:YopX family protein [Segatella buccae]
MNREIKFKGQPTGKGGAWMVGIGAYKTHTAEHLVLNAKGDSVEVVHLCQSTGLKDCNGKEIYEGDILRVSEYENILMREFDDSIDCFDMFTLDEITGDFQQSYTSPVIWEEGTFCISTKGDWLHHNDMFLAVLFGDMKRSSPIFIFEVIGNIHDNPEMMKGGEK